MQVAGSRTEIRSGMPVEKDPPASSTGAIRMPNRKDGPYQVKDQVAYCIGTTYWALNLLTAVTKGKQVRKVIFHFLFVF